MFQIRAVEKIKTDIIYIFNTFSHKSCRLRDNVEIEYGRYIQATDHNKIRCIRFAQWISKSTDVHKIYEIFIVFPQQKWLRERSSILRLHLHFLSSYCLAKCYDQL